MNSCPKSEFFLADPDQTTKRFYLSGDGLTEIEIGNTWHPPTIAALNHLCTSINDT
ncbi:hypothetical protein CLU84_2052 [Comamonas sp. 26]|nr:hypothetical protein CLU84_2052 [Comamonas sp. 26]